MVATVWCCAQSARRWGHSVSAFGADRAEIDRFVNTLFLYADRDNFVSLRAFRDDADGVWRYEGWPTVQIGNTLDALIEAAFRFSDSCAAADEPVCFAPPIATFNNPDRADQASLANGLVISAELDSTPRRARTARTGARTGYDRHAVRWSVDGSRDGRGGG
jgi:hypothetical protein